MTADNFGRDYANTAAAPMTIHRFLEEVKEYTKEFDRAAQRIEDYMYVQGLAMHYRLYKLRIAKPAHADKFVDRFEGKVESLGARYEFVLEWPCNGRVEAMCIVVRDLDRGNEYPHVLYNTKAKKIIVSNRGVTVLKAYRNGEWVELGRGSERDELGNLPKALASVFLYEPAVIYRFGDMVCKFSRHIWEYVKHLRNL